MLSNFSALVLVSLQLLLPWLASCSKRTHELEHSKNIEYSKLDEFLSSFTSMLTNSGTDKLDGQPQEHLRRYCPHKELYLMYLICSAAVSEKVDEAALAVLHGLYGTKNGYLSDLLNKLKEENSRDTVAEFISENLWSEKYASFPRFLVVRLMLKQRTAMEALALKVLDIAKNGDRHRAIYNSVLAILSIDQQSEMPANLHIHGSVADKPMQDYASMGIADPSLSGVLLSLNEDLWQGIFKFLDYATALGSLPLVCKAWNDAMPLKILIHDIRSYKKHLQALIYADFRDHDFAQLSSYLPDEKSVLIYFGRLFMYGAFSEAELKKQSFKNQGERYLNALTSGEIRPPKARDRTFLRGQYVELFKWVHGFLIDKPIFDKPAFFTNYEYGQAIRQLVCENGLALKLPESLFVRNMLELFESIEKDGELMKKLIYGHFRDFIRPSMILILDQREDSTLRVLAQLVFSQTSLFKKLAGESWTSIAYLDIMQNIDVFRIVAVRYHSFPEFVQIFVLTILEAKRFDDSGVQDIMTAMSNVHGIWRDSCRLSSTKSKFEQDLDKYLKDTNQTQEDVAFIQGVINEYVHERHCLR